MMLKIKRLLLGVLTAFFPVVLAACYGPPVKYINPPENAKSCTVTDADTGEGIPGIHATCIVDTMGEWTTVSNPDGVFKVVYKLPCKSLFLEDVDGQENGGDYGGISVDFPAENEECSYQLKKTGI